MRIKPLIQSLGITNIASNLEDFEVKGLSCNSKAVKDGFVFVAIKGAREDGNKFIDEAIAKGAKAVVVKSPLGCARGKPVTSHKSQFKVPFIRVKDARRALAKLAVEFYGNPTAKIKVVGVTGTNGKTTITYLIEALLKEAGFQPAVIGTINYRFKDRIIPSKNTTPGPLELQSMFCDMLKEGIDYAVMEVSSHALDQERTAGINFHSAIFTNLTQDHLDYHKTLENYFRAKAKLFKDISPDSFIVINEDDKYARRLKKLRKQRIITYGIDNRVRVTARNIKFDHLYTQFQLVSSQVKENFKTRLIGRHNVYNILAAIAWAQEEGIDFSVIKSSLEGFSLVPGRLERVDFEGDFSVIVDYAHTEDALRNIITTLRQVACKRIIVVFGCGGERDRAKRPKMGRTVTELADYAVITSDNPRSEDPLDIIKDIKRGIRKTNFCVIPERREAIKKALSLAKTGDTVLLAGKGHENYQIIKDKMLHFDDREVARECLRSMIY